MTEASCKEVVKPETVAHPWTVFRVPTWYWKY